MTVTSPTGELVLDPYDYDFQEDPYPTYARLRAEAPLYHNVEQDFWALSRHADIAAACREDATYSNAMGVSIDRSAWSPQARSASIRLSSAASRSSSSAWVAATAKFSVARSASAGPRHRDSALCNVRAAACGVRSSSLRPCSTSARNLSRSSWPASASTAYPGARVTSAACGPSTRRSRETCC